MEDIGYLQEKSKISRLRLLDTVFLVYSKQFYRQLNKAVGRARLLGMIWRIHSISHIIIFRKQKFCKTIKTFNLDALTSIWWKMSKKISA